MDAAAEAALNIAFQDSAASGGENRLHPRDQSVAEIGQLNSFMNKEILYAAHPEIKCMIGISEQQTELG